MTLVLREDDDQIISNWTDSRSHGTHMRGGGAFDCCIEAYGYIPMSPSIKGEKFTPIRRGRNATDDVKPAALAYLFPFFWDAMMLLWWLDMCKKLGRQRLHAVLAVQVELFGIPSNLNWNSNAFDQSIRCVARRKYTTLYGVGPD